MLWRRQRNAGVPRANRSRSDLRQPAAGGDDGSVAGLSTVWRLERVWHDGKSDRLSVLSAALPSRTVSDSCGMNSAKGSMRKRIVTVLCLCGAALLSAAEPARVPVLSQIALPHHYYFRELYLPQITTGPSAPTWTPDGKTVIYSMGGTLWRQAIDDDVAEQLTDAAGTDYQPDCSPDGRSVAFVRYDGRAVELVQLDLAT